MGYPKGGRSEQTPLLSEKQMQYPFLGRKFKAAFVLI
jgi:hypothetical protein